MTTAHTPPRRSPVAGTPTASSEQARQRMQRQAQKDTGAERALRSALHRLGLRYRIDCVIVPGLRRRADVMFPRAKVVVLVDGCFWHGCPIHATWPKANAEWWRQKLEANRARDTDTNVRLAQAGWEVVRIWEHEDVDAAAGRVADVVRQRQQASPTGRLCGR